MRYASLTAVLRFDDLVWGPPVGFVTRGEWMCPGMFENLPRPLYMRNAVKPSGTISDIKSSQRQAGSI